MATNIGQNVGKGECTPEFVIVKEEADDNVCAADEVSLYLI